MAIVADLTEVSTTAKHIPGTIEYVVTKSGKIVKIMYVKFSGAVGANLLNGPCWVLNVDDPSIVTGDASAVAYTTTGLGKIIIAASSDNYAWIQIAGGPLSDSDYIATSSVMAKGNPFWCGTDGVFSSSPNGSEPCLGIVASSFIGATSSQIHGYMLFGKM